MRVKYLLLCFLFLGIENIQSQIVDKVGINLGLTYSNQLRNYTGISISDKSNMDYKFGFSFFLTTEKKLSKKVSFRPEMGYIQKGFKNNIELVNEDGSTAEVNHKNVIFHDFGVNLNLIISPFECTYKPYAIFGLSSDYLLSYRDIYGKEKDTGISFPLFKNEITSSNKFNLGGLIGIGMAMKNNIYFEIVYNPSITKSYSSDLMSIKDNCLMLKIGYYFFKSN